MTMQKKAENKQTKIYIIIGLLIILCVVGYFRFFHKKSESPEVRPVATPGVVPPIAPGVVPPAIPTTAVPAVAAPLQQVDIQALFRQELIRDVARDIFEPGESVKKVEVKPQVVDEAKPREVSLALSGMIYSKNNPVAIINGKIYRTGDDIEGYKIISIGPMEVFMKGEDREISLRIVDYEEK